MPLKETAAFSQRLRSNWSFQSAFLCSTPSGEIDCGVSRMNCARSMKLQSDKRSKVQLKKKQTIITMERKSE